MKENLNRSRDQHRYRSLSILLMAVSFLPAIGLFAEIPEWLAILMAGIGVAAWIVLSVETYHQLRRGGFSGNWVWMMILPLGFGPSWQVTKHVTFNLGGILIGCIPVVLAWFALRDLEARQKADVA